jgi:uncharacterized membrane protein
MFLSTDRTLLSVIGDGLQGGKVFLPVIKSNLAVVPKVLPAVSKLNPTGMAFLPVRKIYLPVVTEVFTTDYIFLLVNRAFLPACKGTRQPPKTPVRKLGKIFASSISAV